MCGELCIYAHEEGADAGHLVVLADYLRAELLQLDVEDVSALSSGEPPLGARASDVTVVGGLLVTLGQASEGLRSVVSAVMDWLQRGSRAGRTVRLELDGDAIELSQARRGDQERLIELFISRHSGTRSVDGSPEGSPE
jgi:hypothetical protein